MRRKGSILGRRAGLVSGCRGVSLQPTALPHRRDTGQDIGFLLLLLLFFGQTLSKYILTEIIQNMFVLSILSIGVWGDLSFCLKLFSGAREMTSWLRRAFVAFAEDPGLVPSTHIASHNSP